MNRIGLGIITCNREDFYKECYDSVPLDIVDELVTVNDGSELTGDYPHSKIITHKKNKGVGISKNEAMKYLLDKDCEHIFLIEDDIIIKDKNVFQKYIDTAAVSGIWHLMFGYHGPANKTQDHRKDPRPRAVTNYGDHSVAMNQHCVGAFCYYHKGVLNNIGLMDEKFLNAWEHVDHSYQIAKAGLIPGMWWWPDVANSYDYLAEQACSEENSSIRPRSDWNDNIKTGADYFYSKNGYYPAQVPDSTNEQIENRLNFIKQNYSKDDVQS